MEQTLLSQDAYRLFHNGSLELAEAEMNGIYLDTNYCTKKTVALSRKITYLQKRLEQTELIKVWRETYGDKTNFNSDAQLAKILYSKMGITPPNYTPSKRGAVDEKTLMEIDNPALDYILRIRKTKKNKDTYLASFIRESVDGIIHPFFNLNTVRTFRSSSNNPNFQNIPKRNKEAKKICRRAIIPRPGHQLMEVDFSALEVNISQCYHKDPTMYRDLTEPGADMHRDMAQEIFIMDSINNEKYPSHDTLRQAAKNGFVFPQFYGDYFGSNAFYLSDWVKLPTEGVWKDSDGIRLDTGENIGSHMRRSGVRSFRGFLRHLEQIEKHFWGVRYSVYRDWRKRWYEEYQKKGYCDTLTGFRCGGVMKRNEVINYPIQGSAFHCLLWCFIQLSRAARKEGWRTKLIGQIHDSMILDVCPDEREYVIKKVRQITEKDLRESWEWIVVPLSVDVDLYEINGPWLS